MQTDRERGREGEMYIGTDGRREAEREMYAERERQVYTDRCIKHV